MTARGMMAKPFTVMNCAESSSILLLLTRIQLRQEFTLGARVYFHVSLMLRN
jgi:hypothetical protein